MQIGIGLPRTDDTSTDLERLMHGLFFGTPVPFVNFVRTIGIKALLFGDSQLQRQMREITQKWVLEAEGDPSIIGHILSYYTFFAPQGELTIPWEDNLYRYLVEFLPLTPPVLGPPLMAYGLVPQDGGPPFLIFAATCSMLGVLADINPFFSAGTYPFHYAKPQLLAWLNRFPLHSTVACGMSLGGSLALLAHQSLPIAKAYTYNPSGLTPWQLNPHTQAEPPHVYYNAGDIVPLSGPSWPANTRLYRLESPTTARRNPFLAHLQCVGAMQGHIRSEVPAENSTWKRKIVAWGHLAISPLLFPLLALPYALYLVLRAVVRASVWIFQQMRQARVSLSR